MALRVSGDQAAFYGCGFYGAQDTLNDDRGRHYFRECFIQGSIDFIFGSARSLYEVQHGLKLGLATSFSIFSYIYKKCFFGGGSHILHFMLYYYNSDDA